MELSKGIKVMPDNKIVFILLFSIVFSYFYIDLGFAFKPYMIFSIILFVVSLKRFVIHKLFLFELFMVLFFFYYTSTGLLSPFKANSLRMALGIYLVLFCYFVMRYVFSKAKISTIENAISAAGIVFNVASIALYVLGLFKLNFVLSGNGFVVNGVMMDRDLPRLVGLTNDPNIYSFYNFIFFFYFITHLNKKHSKFGAALSGLTILLTLSRGAILSVFVSLAVMFVLTKTINKLKLVIAIPVLTISLNYIVKISLKIDIINMISSRFLAVDGGSGRVSIWERGINLLVDNNIFLGVGINNFRPLAVESQGSGIYMHNSYMEALVEGGLIGFSLYVLIFLTIGMSYYKYSNKIKDKRYLLYSFIAISIMMTTYSFMVNEVFFLLLALIWRYFHEIKYPDDSKFPEEIKIKHRKKYKVVWSK